MVYQCAICDKIYLDGNRVRRSYSKLRPVRKLQTTAGNALKLMNMDQVDGPICPVCFYELETQYKTFRRNRLRCPIRKKKSRMCIPPAPAHSLCVDEMVSKDGGSSAKQHLAVQDNEVLFTSSGLWDTILTMEEEVQLTNGQPVTQDIVEHSKSTVP